MNNLIKEAQARHDADETWYAYWESAYHAANKIIDGLDAEVYKLRATIKAIGELPEKWRDEDDIMSHGGRLLTALDCVEDIEALLNGDPK